MLPRDRSPMTGAGHLCVSDADMNRDTLSFSFPLKATRQSWTGTEKGCFRISAKWLPELGQKRAVSGPQWSGCQTALYLAQAGDSLHDFHKLWNPLIKFKWRNKIAGRQKSIYTSTLLPAHSVLVTLRPDFLSHEAPTINQQRQIKIHVFIKLQDITSHSLSLVIAT